MSPIHCTRNVIAKRTIIGSGAAFEKIDLQPGRKKSYWRPVTESKRQAEHPLRATGAVNGAFYDQFAPCLNR